MRVLDSQGWIHAVALASTIAMQSLPAAIVFGAEPPARTPDTLFIPAGTKIKVDGIAAPGEWGDADTLVIPLSSEWIVRVLLKHDGKSLYVAFSNLVRDGKERYPEVLIDAKGNGGSSWDIEDWWLHASYTDCVGQGKWDVYGHPACLRDAYGWQANNFPLSSEGTVEFRIALDFVRLVPRAPDGDRVFGLALNVADMKSSTLRFFWPPRATMTHPRTWASARLSSPR